MKVERLLQKKGSAIHSIEPQALLYNALEKMSQEGIGSLLVMQEDKVEGILTERDYARKLMTHGKLSKQILVREVMTTPVCYVTKEKTMNECLVLMTEKHFRHLPVMEGNKLLGMISIVDVVKSIIDQGDYMAASFQDNF